MDTLISNIDPFIFQLVIVPLFAIGLGVTISILVRRVLLAPIITFLLTALIDWLVIGQLTSWSWMLPLVSLIIVGFVAFVKKYSIKLNDET